jgi:hypothetical protein
LEALHNVAVYGFHITEVLYVLQKPLVAVILHDALQDVAGGLPKASAMTPKPTATPKDVLESDTSDIDACSWACSMGGTVSCDATTFGSLESVLVSTAAMAASRRGCGCGTTLVDSLRLIGFEGALSATDKA